MSDARDVIRPDGSVPVRVERSDLDGLFRRARALAASGHRVILGITGAPGAGKSTLAHEIVDALAPAAALVPMDGFHLAEDELKRLGRHDRKGAIDTFDAGGFVTLLRRLRERGPNPVYAPTFRRDLEEAIAGAIRVDPDVPLIVTEGNYLLVTEGEWSEVRGLLDEVWYLDPDEGTRLDRLVRRHMDFGRDPETADARARGTDQRNADLIASTKALADVVVAGT